MEVFVITITKLKAMNEECLKAYFSFSVDKWGDFYVRNCKLFEKNGHRWINFPDERFESDGVMKYSAYCGFAKREIKDKFEKEVILAIDYFISVTNPTEQQEIPF